MFTSITSRASVLVTTIVVLVGGAVLRSGAAAADPNQDEQFRALLEMADIPSQANMSSLIATAHKVCRKLDGGMSVDALVDTMRNNAYDLNPRLRLAPARRLNSTMTRFITAAVEAYCPYDQGKIAASMAGPAAYTRNAVNSGGGILTAGRYRDDRSGYDAHATVLVSLSGALPSGEITPNPPQIPPPPPPTAQIETPRQPIVVPHRPKQAPTPPRQSPPLPKQPASPAKQPPPPAVAPQPGGAAGSVGGGGSGGPSGGTGGGGPGGGNGGAGPAEPPPEPPMPPGVVGLAP